MPVLAPMFRELNYQRINELSNCHCFSDEDIATIIYDETNGNVNFTPSEISGYRAVTEQASKQMLIRSQSLKAIRDQQCRTHSRLGLPSSY